MSNVTPLRPGRRKTDFDLKTPEGQITLVYGLMAAAFLASLAGGLIGMIGIGCGVASVAISASKRDEGPTWARSHFEFALRTIVIGGVGWTLLSIIGIIPVLGWLITWALKPVILVWVLVRGGMGFMKSLQRKPVPRPESWLL